MYLGGNGIGPEAAPALAELLRRNRTLAGLFLSANRLGDAGAEVLAAGLAANNTLRTLSLPSNGIGPRGGAALPAAVRDHPSVCSLDLGYCKSTPAVGASPNCIGDAGAAAAAEVIAANRVLAELDLTRNGLTPAGVSAIVAALEGNTSLVRLTIAIPLPARLRPRLKDLIARNRRGVDAAPVDPDVAAIKSAYRT